MQKQHFSEPVCQNTLCYDDDIQKNYCPCCGQAIDWTKFNNLKEGDTE